MGPDMMRRLRSDEGTTIIEVSSVVAVLGIILAIVLAVLASSQTNLEREISRSESNGEIGLAAQSLDREIRSGQVFYDPAGEEWDPSGTADIASGMSVRVYTQANAPSRSTGGADDGSRCVQWRVTSNQELQRREWAPNWHDGDYVSGWRTVATGIQNRVENTPAFSRPLPNIVDIVLRSNQDASARKGSTVEVRLSVSGRNSDFQTTDQTCGPPTPQPLVGVQGQVPGY